MTEGSKLPDLSALSRFAPELATTLVSLVGDIALIVDDEGVIRNVVQGDNPLAPMAAGWVGQPWAATVTGDTRRKIDQVLDEARSRGISRRREVNLALSFGQSIPVSYAAVKLGADGPLLALGRDLRTVAAIQQRFMESQAEMERQYWRQRQLEAHYRTLFQVAHDAALVLDAGSLQVRDANDAACRLLGCELDELRGRPLPQAVSPLSAHAVEELLRSVAHMRRSGEIRVALSGMPRLARLTVALLPKAKVADGATPMLLVRAHAEAGDESASAEHRFVQFCQRTPEGLVVVDTGGRIQMFNPAFTHWCDPGRRFALKDAALADVLHLAADKVDALLGECLTQGIVHSRVLMLGTRGRVVETAVSAALLPGPGQTSVGLSLRALRSWRDDKARSAELTGERLRDALGDLFTRLGQAEFSELVAQGAALVEGVLIDQALRECEFDPLRAAALLAIDPERVRARQIDAAGVANPVAATARGGDG
jgi:transcriptional regulator PpsR